MECGRGGTTKEGNKTSNTERSSLTVSRISMCTLKILFRQCDAPCVCSHRFRMMVKRTGGIARVTAHPVSVTPSPSVVQAPLGVPIGAAKPPDALGTRPKATPSPYRAPRGSGGTTAQRKRTGGIARVTAHPVSVTPSPSVVRGPLGTPA